jgi:recombination protein RecA
MSKALDELKAAAKSPTPEPKPPATQKPLSTEDKWKALKAVEATLNKQFSTTTSLVRLGSKVGQLLPSIGGDIPTFDFDVIGTGGIPRGRIVEFFGPESSGKTTLALHYVAKEQKRGGICAYIDAEHALDPTYMKRLGVDVDNLLVSQPDSGEQALETAEALVESRAVELIVVDSVAALVPQAELDGEMGDSHMGLQARLLSQAMRKLRGKCAMNNVTIIFINQIREKLGVMFGSPETTTGGRALKFYSSVRVDIRKIGGEEGQIKSGSVLIGHKMKLKAVKNKVGTPLRQTLVDLIYGIGIDTEADAVEYAISVGAIQQSGAWFDVPGGFDRVQGKANVKALLRDDAKVMTVVKAEIAKAQQAQRETEAA